MFVSENDTDCPNCLVHNNSDPHAVTANLTPVCLEYMGRKECKVCSKRQDESFNFLNEFVGCTVRAGDPICDPDCTTSEVVEHADSAYLDRMLIPACHRCTVEGKHLNLILNHSNIVM